MNELTYTAASAGGWVAVTARTSLVVLHPAGDRLDDVWKAVQQERAFDAVIRILTRDGFDALPEFAVVDASGGRLRVVVRGGVTVEVDDSAGTHEQSGLEVSTWTERGFSGATAVRLTVDGVTEAAGMPRLPLASGVALVGSCSMLLGGTTESGDAVREPSERQEHEEPQEEQGPQEQGRQERQTSRARPASEAPAPETSAHAASEHTVSTTTLVSAGASEETVSSVDTDSAATADSDAPADTDSDSDSGTDTDTDAISGDTVFVPRRRPAGSIPPPPPATAAAAAAAKPAAPSPAAPSPVTLKPRNPAPATSKLPSPEPTPDGDHDGLTIVSSDLPKGRTRAAPRQPEQEKRPQPAPVVLDGSDGVRHPLHAPVIVGRAPSASQVSGGALPTLVTVGGSDPDISRTHARFALEGDSVVVTDLHSRNGTLVVLPGKPPQKLRAGEPTTVIVGTVVDLGGGISFTVSGG